MATLSVKPTINIDGVLTDWVPAERIDYGDLPGFTFYATAQGDNFDFALSAPVAIGANTTFWFDTDQNATTGYQIFGFAGGAEFNLNVRSDGTAAVYTGGAGETLVLDNIPVAYSADQTVIEFAIPKSALGNPEAMNVLYDVNDSLFGPSNYSAQPYVAYNNDLVRTDPTHRIGIVFSQTTENNYFSKTAYAQLLMAVESQAMQAGISFDLLTEADLTNAAKLANYDALVFPSMANVQASQVAAITNTLLEVTKQFGVGLITAGNFLTNDETGAALPGDAYARMKLLFDATRVTGGFPADVALTAGDAASTVFTTLAPGDLIHNYQQVAWDAFQSVSGNGQTLATETVGGQSYAAALATQTGGKNVLFSTPGVMADNNLLWQAIDYAAKPAGIQLSLDLTRFKGIVASRTDMDQSMYREDVSPEGGGPGIYDKLLPILAEWKQDYNFVGSYYVNIGNDPAQGQTTDWSVSAPYYAQLLAMGNELGTHSYTHPEDTNTLTPAQLEFEFEQAKLVLEQQMSAYLGTPFTVTGAAVPGAVETLATSQQIIQYFDYMTGGFSGVGAGYPGAFGFLSPDLTNAVYLSPDTSFDFTLLEYQHLDPAAAAAAWGQEWNQLVANAYTPIVLWPWHDYGAAAWPTDPPNPSPYTTQLFTDWIARAYSSGAEFVTEADLAARIQSFYHSGVTSTINGNTIDVTVTSSHAGDFALNLSGLGSQVIASVAGWYAYDGDSLFLPDSGGSFSITTGATPADVTHIVALPMRADLLSVAGDGVDLSFSLIGEGDVQIALGQVGSGLPLVTGGSIASMAGGTLDITLAGIGLHDVTVRFQPAEAVGSIAFSADSGVSANDFITNVAAQTISGTLTAGLAAGDTVQLSLDNGANWLTATALVGGTAFSLTGAILTGSNTLIGRVNGANGLSSAALTQAYVLDQQAPTPPPLAALAPGSDSGSSASDNITNVTTPTLTGLAEAGATVTLYDGAGTSGTGIVGLDGAWSITSAALATGVHSLTTKAIDSAGNASAASAALAVTIDITAPAAPSRPDLAAASDTGASSTDNITSVTSPVFAGTAEAGSIITLLDGTTAIGTAIAVADRNWSITASPLLDGVHGIAAVAADIAGNVSLASAALVVTIDSQMLAPSPPDMTAATDKGVSDSDDITNDATPTFTGTAEAGGTITLLDGATTIGTARANAAGVWTITSASLADGMHSISAAALDAAGNLSTSAALAVTIDTLPPAAPPMAALAPGSDSGSSASDNITNITTPSFVGTAEAGATVTLYNGTTKVGTGIAGADGTWSITASKLAAGVRSITVKATDIAGNLGAASPVLAVTIDTTIARPARPDLVASSDSGVSATDNLTNITTPDFTGTAEAGSLVTLLDGTTAIGSAIAAPTGTWTITAAPLADGTHAIAAIATDTAGNVSLASVALAVTIDTTALAASPPDMTAATDKGASNSDNITNDATPTFTGTAQAGGTITLLDGATTIGTARANAAGVWTITSAALADGMHSISAAALNAAGNLSTSAALAVTIDTLPPAAPPMAALAPGSDSGSSASDNITNITTPSFVGTAEAGATVTLYNGTTKVGTGIAGADGTWSITASKLAAGVRSITVKATDIAGNLGAASPVLAVTIDTTIARPARPDLVASSDSGVSATDNLTNITTPDFTGTAEAGSLVTLLDGTTAIGSAIAAPTGTWTITAAPLADGTHAIAAIATDTAGNVSLASVALAVTIDTTAPPAPVFVAGTASSVSGTGEAGATVTLLDSGTIVGTATIGATGSWNLKFLAAGSPRALSTTATDRAGNTGAPTSGMVLLGTAGADTLAGGTADDIFIGGAGVDLYAFQPGSGHDIIADFAPTGTAHDIISFHGISALSSFADVLSHASAVGTGVVIAFDAENSLTLNNVTPTRLTAADFTFV